MLLVLIVLHTADTQKLADVLVEKQLRVTQIASMGGWLGLGNDVLLLGIDEVQYDDVVHAVESTCERRLELMSTAAMVDPTLGYATTVEVEVGGAVMFGIPVERFVRIPGGTDWQSGTVPSDSEEGEAMTTAETDAERPRQGGTKLVVAVVKGEDVDAVMAALLESDIRLTRIKSTGGFLRRGNSTLLIGVPADEVDEVIRLIREACPDQTEASPITKGLPMYSATVFVLDSAHFERL